MNKDFEKRSDEFAIEVDKYLEGIIDDYLAFYIQAMYNKNLICNENIVQIINSAIEDITCMRLEMCNKDRVKELLKKCYKLDVKSETPLLIERNQ